MDAGVRGERLYYTDDKVPFGNEMRCSPRARPVRPLAHKHPVRAVRPCGAQTPLHNIMNNPKNNAL